MFGVVRVGLESIKRGNRRFWEEVRKLRKTGSDSASKELINTAQLIWRPQALGLKSRLAEDRRKHVCGNRGLTFSNIIL
jgi:hypothetical protein